MIRFAACAAIALFLSLAPVARAADAEGGVSSRLIEYSVKTKLKNYEQLTLFLLPPVPQDAIPADMKMPFLWLCHFLCCQNSTLPYI